MNKHLFSLWLFLLAGLNAGAALACIEQGDAGAALAFLSFSSLLVWEGWNA